MNNTNSWCICALPIWVTAGGGVDGCCNLYVSGSTLIMSSMEHTKFLQNSDYVKPVYYVTAHVNTVRGCSRSLITWKSTIQTIASQPRDFFETDPQRG